MMCSEQYYQLSLTQHQHHAPITLGLSQILFGLSISVFLFLESPSYHFPKAHPISPDPYITSCSNSRAESPRFRAHQSKADQRGQAYGWCLAQHSLSPVHHSPFASHPRGRVSFLQLRSRSSWTSQSFRIPWRLSLHAEGSERDPWVEEQKGWFQLK